MHIQDFFQNFLKLFLVGLHSDCTINLIAQDMSPQAGAGTVPTGWLIPLEKALPPPPTAGGSSAVESPTYGPRPTR